MQPIFMNPNLGELGIEALGPPQPIFSRGAEWTPSDEVLAAMAEIKRGEFTGDMSQILMQLGQDFTSFTRAITSTTSNFPIREDLEAEAALLMPLDTPVRNMTPRSRGNGSASAWQQITSVGGGMGGFATSTASGNTSGQATLTVDNAGGFYAGDAIQITGGTTENATILSIVYSTNVITLTGNLANTQNSKTVKRVGVQNPTQTAIRAFFQETGAPADHGTSYGKKTASYKLMGLLGSITGFAMAQGATFQNALAMEKLNQLRALMLNEENALINGDSTSLANPWGDGSNALAFDGLLNLITTANGVPVNQVQSSVGALTTAHLDAQLSRLWLQGAEDIYLMMNEQETRSLAHLAEASGSIIRVQATSDGQTVLGVRVTGYVHPVTGQLIPIIASRFLAPGTIIFGCKRLPDGKIPFDVRVLPQVQLPQLAPDAVVQGYTAQEIAPSVSAPQTYSFILTTFQTTRLRSALHFAKSTGVTAV